VINLTDYGIIRDNLEEAHNYLFEGDIVRDGFVNLNDFRAWKNLPSVISSGVLAQIAAIPEPSSLVLLLGSAVIVGGRRRKPMQSQSTVASGQSMVPSFPRRREPRSNHCNVCKIIPSLLVVLCLGLVSSISRAELLYYDPFNIGASPAAGQYTTGALIPTFGNGQNPTIGPTPFMTGAWAANAADSINNTVQAQGLSFIGAPVSGGSLGVLRDADNVVQSSRAFRQLTTPFTATTEGTYYFSFLANFGGVGVSPTSASRDDVAHRAVEFQQGSDEGSNIRIGYASYNGNFNSLPPAQAPLKFGPFGQEVLIAGAPANFIADNGTTHLVVMKFTMSATDLMDSVELFLDPTDNEEPVVADASFFNRNIAFDRVSGPVQFGGAGTPMQFDEFRVANTYIDVLPDFPMKGDTNNDDLVNMADYLNIYQHLNLTGGDVPSSLELHPDVTGDGRVDLRDIALWRANRTGGALTGEVTVPEPTSLILLTSLAILALGRRRA
jgi:hypothetical protein